MSFVSTELFFPLILFLRPRITLADTTILDTGPERYTDAPIRLQLVCRRFEDEKVIAVYEYLNSLEVFKE